MDWQNKGSKKTCAKRWWAAKGGRGSGATGKGEVSCDQIQEGTKENWAETGHRVEEQKKMVM